MDEIQEAMDLASKLQPDQIRAAFEPAIRDMYPTVMHTVADAFDSPGPQFGAQDVEGMYDSWGPEQHKSVQTLMFERELRQLAARTTIHPAQMPHKAVAWDLHGTYPDGKRAYVGVPAPTKIGVALSPSEEQAFKRRSRNYEAIIKASSQIAVPKTTAGNNVKIDALMRAALLRRAAASGAGINVLATAAFDVRLLMDGEVKAYLTRIGVNGLYGGTVSGCSAWINHPVFRNSALLGIVVGAAFGTVSLASTGDWERFGKNTGLGIIGSAGAWAGAQAGARAGTRLGPLGTFFGGVAGGLAGGIGAHKVAAASTSLTSLTDMEIDAQYDRMKEQFAGMGFEPDASLSRREFVERFLAQASNPTSSDPALVVMTSNMASHVVDMRKGFEGARDADPAAFATALQRLREMAASTS